LVNKAGIITKEEACGLEVTLAAVRETLETNTLAPLYLSQTLVPLVKRSKAGRIVNISCGMGQLSEMKCGYALNSDAKCNTQRSKWRCCGRSRTDSLSYGRMAKSALLVGGRGKRGARTCSRRRQRSMANFLVGPPAAIGAVLAIATIPLHLFLSKAHSEQFAALLLACMGAIYAGFGLQKGNSSQIAAEVAAATGLFVGSLAALWVSAWVVPIAYIAHGIWDYAHTKDRHLRRDPGSLSSYPHGILPSVPSTTGWRRQLWRSFGACELNRCIAPRSIEPILPAKEGPLSGLPKGVDVLLPNLRLFESRIGGARWIDFCSARAPSWSRRLWRNCACQ
jgi:short chain dehydrogenase